MPDGNYTLYWERMSGAIAPQCVLAEMGLGYRKVHVDFTVDAQKGPDYSAVCPTQRVPALTTPDGITLGESGAITLLLGERHPGSGLVPEPGEPDRAAFLYWLFYMASVGYPTFSRNWHPEQFTEEPAAEASISKVAADDLARLFAILDGAIAGSPHFLPCGFTALDIYLEMLTRWHPDRDALLARHPRIAGVCAAVLERPASAAVLGEHFGG